MGLTQNRVQRRFGISGF